MNYPNKICKPFIALPTVFTDQLSWYDTLSKLYGYLQQQEDIIKDIQEQIENIDFDVDISTDPIIVEIKQNIQQLQTSLAQTNQNVQGLQQGVANLGQQLQALTNRVSALEQNYGILESSAVLVEEIEVVPFN